MTQSALRKAVDAFGLTEHADRLDDRARDASFGLLAMVVGAGNYGKSSLINALCGKSVAPVSVLPKTFKIDVFAPGDLDTALVRRVGCPLPTECSQAEARLIEAAEEKRRGAGGDPPLAEIVWRYGDLALPPGISIIDTPGISQALRGAAKGVSLTKVLGSTFEVDEVWARWFHRADVVIWAFCANKLEDADTRAALEAALNLFDKPLIPVATKADLIRPDRWDEIRDRFQCLYGDLLETRRATKLYLTVTGGSHPELVGTGIGELRSCLELFAADAGERKVRAEADYVRDESKAVGQVLDETAKLLVANLRSIASLGDSLAVEASNEAERGRQEAASRVGSYLRELQKSSSLEAAALAVHVATDGGRSGDIEAAVREQLIGLVDQGQIERHVNEAFGMSSRSLEALARKMSSGVELARLSFRSSGKVDRVPIAFNLKLEAFSITSELAFPLRFEQPVGFLATAWDSVKGVLKIDRFTVSDIREAMIEALSIPQEAFNESMVEALYNGFAPALRLAVDSAMREHLSTTDARALELLRQVDVYVPDLDPPDEAPRVTTYGAQGEYWATLDPATETLLDMARDELMRTLPKFVDLLQDPFPVDLPRRLPSFLPYWKRRSLSRKAVTVQIGLSNVLAVAQCREPMGPDDALRFRYSPFLTKLQESQLAHLSFSPLLAGLDARLAKSVVGANYRSAGSRLAEIGTDCLQTACAESSRVWTVQEPHIRVGQLSFNKVMLGVIGVMAVAAVAYGQGHWVLCLAALVCCIALGLVTPAAMLTFRYWRGSGQVIGEEIQSCQEDSVALLPPSMVDQVIAGMSAELAPRPLQRLLDEAGQL